MDHSIAIRTTLFPGDLGYVAYLHGTIYAHEYQYGKGFESYVLEGLAGFLQQYDPEKDKVWICEAANNIIGFLLAFNKSDIVQLRFFIIHPDYRGQGLGRRLMDEFIHYLKEKSVKKAFLWTTDDLPAACSLYTSFGFTLTDKKISGLFGKQLTELRYELSL